MSPGKIAEPPQPIGSFQPTKVNWLTEAGAATPAHHTGSRCKHAVLVAHHAIGDQRLHVALDHAHAEDVAEDAGANVAIASATQMQPSGIASMAERVEIGLSQLAGVARSSRTGTKRKVKAGPTMRLPL